MNGEQQYRIICATHTTLFLLVLVVISIEIGFSAYYCFYYYYFYVLFFHHYILFGRNFCANFNCDLSLYSLINCNIWRMNNVMHERIEENKKEKNESKNKNKKNKYNCKQSAHQIKFNIERPHATYFQYHW